VIHDDDGEVICGSLKNGLQRFASFPEPFRLDVLSSGQGEKAVDCQRFIEKDVDASRFDGQYRLFGVRVIFMVPEYRVDAEWCGKLRQDLGKALFLGMSDAPVDDVSRHENHIRLRFVDGVHDPVQPVIIYHEACVDVRNQGHPNSPAVIAARKRQIVASDGRVQGVVMSPDNHQDDEQCVGGEKPEAWFFPGPSLQSLIRVPQGANKGDKKLPQVVDCEKEKRIDHDTEIPAPHLETPVCKGGAAQGRAKPSSGKGEKECNPERPGKDLPGATERDQTEDSAGDVPVGKTVDDEKNQKEQKHLYENTLSLPQAVCEFRKIGRCPVNDT